MASWCGYRRPHDESQMHETKRPTHQRPSDYLPRPSTLWYSDNRLVEGPAFGAYLWTVKRY